MSDDQPSLGFWYRRYATLLERYKASESASARRRIERFISRSVPPLQWVAGVTFPKRATGGWWWIDRWRFEFLLGWAERESVAWLQRSVRRGDTALDVGGHIGYYTRLLSKLVGRGGRVIAFEPHPENFSILRHNSRGRSNVEALHVAAGDRDGSTLLFESAGHSNHSLVAEFAGSSESVRVETARIDTLLQRRGIERIAFAKIDVEGAEPLVLDGMKETIARSPGLTLLIEWNPEALRMGGSSPAAFAARLEALGLEVFAIAPDASLHPLDAETQTFCNLLCRRR